MMRLEILAVAFTVLALSSVTAFKGYSEDLVSFTIKADTCVGNSGDQKFCDDFISCVDKFPQKLQDIFHQCVKQAYGEEGLGKCNDKETLFRSQKQLKEYVSCFLTKLPNKSDLSDSDQSKVDDFKKCEYKVAGKCNKQ
ncbi:spider silk-constituting element SpiCE-NMa4 [Nephila pilipes]|uniref:Spider silk-constituting element SpiCE-NMa4 n=1 Tax=Nephila pilipes TaxID=299642 RepID=A0A8X6R2P5_NEPPI|nr:spider silk-constituting element SpiCE-NMa4 [Nephila pilipes]